MNSSLEVQPVEHFCTLFDSNFLPIGITLHSSLMQHSKAFHLWILCMDDLAEKQLQCLNLSHVTLIPLASIETEALLTAKGQRSRGEYCWTLTSFLFSAVFERSSSVQRLTYLDADLFFFRDPKILIDEFEAYGRDVLLTEHAYAPNYDQTHISGRFCVQFMTFNRNESAQEVLHWWQSKCLDWCFGHLEDGKFGDQKYLDLWPSLFPDKIWILQQKENALAPWNIDYFSQNVDSSHQPVFYHFHGFRIVSPKQVLLYQSYRIGKPGLSLYSIYLESIQKTLSAMKESDISIPYIPFSRRNHNLSFRRYLKLYALGYIRFAPLY